MLAIFQGLMVVGGLIVALGVHLFLSKSPATEQVIDKIVEEVVVTTTNVDIAPMEKMVDGVVDVFDGKQNK